MDGPTAANIAREAAETQGTYFTSLSNEMCWDAVALCQGREPGRHIDENATLVRNDGDLSYIPEGATIGFFDGGVLVHAMISLGQGLAAGNKNACIGQGSPIGWEILDLAIGWGGPPGFGPRGLTVRFKPM
jgi:hypothetical protein